jgi:hypothetical protein
MALNIILRHLNPNKIMPFELYSTVPSPQIGLYLTYLLTYQDLINT